jgi:hypothetical protein
MTRHPSTDKLAEYAEGVLRRRTAVRVSSHLGSGCKRCNGKIVQLRQVTSVLTRASTTFGPMPDQLSTRVEMAIASEAEARVTSAPVSGEASRRDLPARGQQRPRQGWRVPGFNSPLAGSLAAVGAAVVIAGGGYEIASHLGTSAPSTSSATAPSAAVPHVNAGVRPASGAAGGAGAAVRYGPAVIFRHAGHQDSIRSVQTGTNFTAAALIGQARTVLNAVRESNLKASNEVMTTPYATPGSSGTIGADQLRACVNKVAAGHDVLLVDVARYEGKAAMIVIVGTAPDGPGVIYAAGQACSAANADILGMQDLPRP